MIEFRAWDKENGIFIYAELKPRMNDPFIAIGDYPKELKFTYPKILEWEQFTGLLDKNGKKIFEGDIVKHPQDGNFIIQWINDHFAAIRLRNNWIDDERMLFSISNIIEVIGNNKEVLEWK